LGFGVDTRGRRGRQQTRVVAGAAPADVVKGRVGAAVAGVAAALLCVGPVVCAPPALAELNRREASTTGEFNVGTAAQYGGTNAECVPLSCLSLPVLHTARAYHVLRSLRASLESAGGTRAGWRVSSEGLDGLMVYRVETGSVLVRDGQEASRKPVRRCARLRKANIEPLCGAGA